MVDPGKGFCPALGNVSDGAFDQRPGIALQVLRDRVFQVHVDEIAPTAPGIVDEPGGDHRHG